MIHRLRILNQAIPTPYSRTQNMELHLISLPCHIDTNPFMSHVEFIPNSSFTIHESCQAYIILHYIHVSHHNIHSQTNTNHPRTNKRPNIAPPRPTPRSGWRVSLSRDVLAQASPPSPRRGLEKGAGAHAGSRLGETPLAWARYSLAQKVELVAWATFRAKMVLGESMFISPRQDWLAWARVTGLATVLLQQSYPSIQNNIPNAFQVLRTSNQSKTLSTTVKQQ